MSLTVALEAIRLFIHNTTHARPTHIKSVLRRIADALLYGVYILIGYMVMLVVMTYNVGLFIAVLAGYCIGNFVFPRKPVPQERIVSGEGVSIMYSPADVEGSCH